MQNIFSAWHGRKNTRVFYGFHMSAQAIAIAARLIVVAYRNNASIPLAA